VIASSVERIERELPAEALVLDVGGWGKPFRRANTVIDRMPFSSRGLYGFDGSGPERFDEGSWVIWDICSRQPWPFRDKQFDFVVCSQTLEDLRDPVWVCSEIVRVGKAGYVEVPSRLEEQSFGVQGPWVGWGHHHWLVDVNPDHIDFVFKHHVIHGRRSAHFPAGFVDALTDDERNSQLWWTDSFSFAERILSDADSLDGYLDRFVEQELSRRQWACPVPADRGVLSRLGRRLRRVVGRGSPSGAEAVPSVERRP
jgi:hypothetical protein